MPRKGYRNVTVKTSTYNKLVEVANLLSKSPPETVEHLTDSFLKNKEGVN
jgi:hypothetical protein